MVQRVPDERGGGDRVGVVDPDLDVVLDVADTGQPGNGECGGGPLAAVTDGAGQREIAVVGDCLHGVRHGDVGPERVVPSVVSMASSR